MGIQTASGKTVTRFSLDECIRFARTDLNRLEILIGLVYDEETKGAQSSMDATLRGIEREVRNLRKLLNLPE